MTSNLSKEFGNSSPFDFVFEEFDRMRDKMFDFFKTSDFPSFDILPFSSTRDYPKTNIVAEKDTGNIRIEMAVPGFKREDIDVEIVDNTLKIAGKMQDKGQCCNDSYHCKSIASRSFVKKWTLPKNANLESLDALLEDGILTVFLPIIKEEPKVKKLTIRTIGENNLEG